MCIILCLVFLVSTLTPLPGPVRVTACDLILEYTLSAAAVAKGFTSYTAALIGVNVKHLRLQVCPGRPVVPAVRGSGT